MKSLLLEVYHERLLCCRHDLIKPCCGRKIVNFQKSSPASLSITLCIHSYQIKSFRNEPEWVAAMDPKAGRRMLREKGCITWFVIFPVFHHHEGMGQFFLCRAIIQIDTSKPKSHSRAQQKKLWCRGESSRSYFKVNWNSRKFLNGESCKLTSLLFIRLSKGLVFEFQASKDFEIHSWKPK